MRKLLVVWLLFGVLGAFSAMSQMSLATPNADDARLLAKSEVDYTVAKKAYKKHASAKTKQACVVATVRYATTSMVAATLPPKTKYKQALRLYREALSLDPSNHEAKSNSELIISIYHQMHRPVP
jgi:hypothetical protein